MADVIDLDRTVDEDEALRIRLGGVEYAIGDVPLAIMERADALLDDVRRRSNRATERAERKAERIKREATARAEALRAEGKHDEADQVIELAEDEAEALIEAAYRSVDQYFFHKRLAIVLGVPEETFHAVGLRKVRKAHQLVFRHLLEIRGEAAGKDGQSTPQSPG